MIPPETLSWLIEVLGPDVEVAEDPLPDTSHTNHRVRADDREMLLRRFTDAELLANDAWYAPADEVSALEALRGVAVPVPASRHPPCTARPEALRAVLRERWQTSR
jgi:hypothetical protein